MSWMAYPVVAAVALAAADVFVKLSSGKVPNSLGVLLYGAVAFSVGLTWFLMDRASGVPLRASTGGIASAIGVGVSFSLVTVGLYAAFAAGAAVRHLAHRPPRRPAGGGRLRSRDLERAGDVTVEGHDPLVDQLALARLPHGPEGNSTHGTGPRQVVR